MSIRRGPETLAVAGLFLLLAIVMTWPLARHLSTEAPLHQDVYFNMWRLRWVAHALATSPRHLFDGNIFYPETQTLALSDAALLEGFIAAPLLWLRLNPVAVQNVLILLPIALSGTAMFVLARHLTGCRGGALLAGLAFAFAGYRFEHLMHLELQWTVWMPLAFLALHRVLETGTLKWGAALGALLALQLLSCIYYGVFLAALLPLAAVLLLPGERAASWRALAPALAAGAAVALMVSLAYARPFMRQHDRVGDRPVEEIASFSAQPADYLIAPAANWLHGNGARPGEPERRLFPGAIVVLLALAGLLPHARSYRTVVYLVLLVAVFEGSVGFSGFSYRFLHAHVATFRSLRAMARLGIFVVMFLAVLGAYGYSAIAARLSPRTRVWVCAFLAAAMLVEYRTGVLLAPFISTAPPLYRLLARQTPGVVAEFPVPRADRLPGSDAEYAYLSTFHWFPLVNGYSGNYPASYLARIDRLVNFPDDIALRQLRSDGVRYVVVHRFGYRDTEVDGIRVTLAGAGMAELGEFEDGETRGLLFAFR